MITVHFPKYIRSLTDGVESQKFEVEDIQSLVDGLRCLFPKLAMYMSMIDSRQISNVAFFVNKETKLVEKFPSGKKIDKELNLALIITIYGAGDDIGGILIGAALIAASFIPGLQGLTVLGMGVASSMLTVGVGMVLTGFIGLLTPKTNSSATAPTDSGIRAQNDAFGPMQNTTTTETPIALIFGQMRVPGQFVGGRVKTINHDASTTISVANYV